jgi:CheY-like chemotaxis protein
VMSADARGQGKSRNGSGRRVAACRVLVVEDDDALCEALRDLLEESGYRVSCAGDGADALATMRRERPSVVILDVLLRTLDGREVRRIQLADPTLAAIPVIGISGDPTARLDDAVPMLMKPFDSEILLDLLELYCRAPVGSSGTGPAP